MGKRLFLLLFISILGVIIDPYFLSADHAPEAKLPDFHAVETVVPEETASNNPETSIATETPKAPRADIAPVIVAEPAPVATKNYTVSYYVGSIEEYTNTAVNLSYSGLYKFSKMIYGHNTANLLGNLSSMYIGEQFTVNENGTTNTYQVVNIVTYRKTADGNLENDRMLMKKIATTAMGSDLALFTCAGTMYGNGDASHRLVVYANRI